MEMLTFTFPHVSGDAATLAFHWGETHGAHGHLVEPSQPVILSADERAQFIGTYALSEIAPIPGWTPEAELRITEGEDGMLRGWMSLHHPPEDANDFDMIPAGMNRFSPGLYQQGKLFNVEPAVAFEFGARRRREGRHRGAPGGARDRPSARACGCRVKG